MNNTIPGAMPSNPTQAMVEECDHSDSHFLMAVGVVLLVCGQAIFGRHEVTMIGLGLIIFSSLFQ